MSCKAMFNGQTIAQSDSCLTTEGNLYFPPDSVNREFLKPSHRRYHCVWKGEAGYYNVSVKGKVARDAAWYYDMATKDAADLKNYVAFDTGLGVEVEGKAVREIKPPW